MPAPPTPDRAVPDTTGRTGPRPRPPRASPSRRLGEGGATRPHRPTGTATVVAPAHKARGPGPSRALARVAGPWRPRPGPRTCEEGEGGEERRGASIAGVRGHVRGRFRGRHGFPSVSRPPPDPPSLARVPPRPLLPPPGRPCCGRRPPPLCPPTGRRPTAPRRPGRPAAWDPPSPPAQTATSLSLPRPARHGRRRDMAEMPPPLGLGGAAPAGLPAAPR